jgi:outer membrane protein assembly factor BamB
MLSTTPQKSFLYAVAPESGSARWVAALDGRDITEPVVARGLVFVAVKDPRSEPRPGYPLGVDSNHTTLYAINAADGQVRWKIAADSNYSSQRLLAADNVIYLATDKRLVAAEPETGRLLWSSSAEGVLHLAADRQRLYLVAHRGSDARLHALAFATGQENWSQGLSGGAGLVVHEGVAYAGTDAVDGATGRKLWSFKGTGRESVQLISGGRAFLISETVTYSGSRRVDDGYLYAIDARTGKP